MGGHSNCKIFAKYLQNTSLMKNATCTIMWHLDDFACSFHKARQMIFIQNFDAKGFDDLAMS